MKVNELIEQGLLEVGYEVVDEYISYETSSKTSLHHNGEEVNSIDVQNDGVVWVITIQGREHVGEFEYNKDDDLPIEVFTKK